MKVIEHGSYYDWVIYKCRKCDCKYEIIKEDIKKYSKPIKLEILSVNDSWTEKRTHYTCCPECHNNNPLEPLDYEVLTSPFYKGDKVINRKE